MIILSQRYGKIQKFDNIEFPWFHKGKKSRKIFAREELFDSCLVFAVIFNSKHVFNCI